MFVSHQFQQEHPQVVLDCIQTHGDANDEQIMQNLHSAIAPSLWINRDIATAWLMHGGWYLVEEFPAEYADDAELFLLMAASAATSTDALGVDQASGGDIYVDDEMDDTSAPALRESFLSFRHDVQFASKELRSDPDFVLQLVSYDARYLQYATKTRLCYLGIKEIQEQQQYRLFFVEQGSRAMAVRLVFQSNRQGEDCLDLSGILLAPLPCCLNLHSQGQSRYGHDCFAVLLCLISVFWKKEGPIDAMTL